MAPAPDVGALSTMAEAAGVAEQAFGVPADLSLAVAYTETRWQIPEDEHGHHADGHVPAAVGVAGLKPWQSNLASLAAQELGSSEEELHENPAAGLVAGAYVLRELADRRYGGPPHDLGEWAEVIADYSGHIDARLRRSYVHDVFGWLQRGIEDTGADGFPIVVAPRDVALPESVGATQSYAGASYPGARWVAAHASNQSNRRGEPIRYVVLHTTQGSYSGAISWFQNPSANVSAHFVIRSSDGEVTQMLDEAANGWHAGNSTYNRQSIGIEHEGFVADPGRWYTDAMYRSSAELTRHICDKYGIPKTRSRIIGHVEVPGATHTDPGTGWDWNRFMALVTGTTTPPIPPPPGTDDTLDAELERQHGPAVMVSGERAAVVFDFRNTGTTPFTPGNTMLVTTRPNERASLLYDPSWLAESRPAGAAVETSAGNLARFGFMVTAPDVDETMTITETYRLRQEPVAWFGPDVELLVQVLPRAAGVEDFDGDGSGADRDCDDRDPDRFPGNWDRCGDGIDQDCTGSDLVCDPSDPTAPPDVDPPGTPDPGVFEWGSDPEPMDSPRPHTGSLSGQCGAGGDEFPGWPLGLFGVLLLLRWTEKKRP